MTHLLRIIREASWKDGPILRGSMVLGHYLGEQARMPRDLDWIVTPTTLTKDSPFMRLFFADIEARLRREPTFEGGAFEPEEIRHDEIRVYDDNPGNRIVFPCRAPHLPRGLVQMDFAFHEPLPGEPVALTFPGAGEVPTASLTQLLAGKLHWLREDAYPLGKDLYDATLLAEHLRESGTPYVFDLPDAHDFSVYRDDFLAEYPEIEGDPAYWNARLQKALA